MKFPQIICSILTVICLPAFATTTITGAGSTFVYPVLSAWASNYAKESGVQINYQSIGSGGGIAQIKAGTVDFAASDKPLSTSDLANAKLTQFPLVEGAIVLSENVKTNKPISLDIPTIANIYLGQIKYWDDAAIQKLNPGVNLPHQRITPIYRADGSGTTYNFTRYLAQASSTFQNKVGADSMVSWPTGVGAKGNAGVANFVHTIPGSIGYMEYAYAHQNHYPIVNIINSQNKMIEPTFNTFTNKTYPFMATTYVLMPKSGKNNMALDAFFRYCFSHPEMATSLDYVPVK